MSASTLFVTVALRKNSDFTEFDPAHYSLDAYAEEYTAAFDLNTVWDKATEVEPLKFLEATFESGNVGALREHLSRSLSVGDVVKFEHHVAGTMYATVEGSGWKFYGLKNA